MAIRSCYSDPAYDDPSRFVGKLLVLPDRFSNEPILLIDICWDRYSNCDDCDGAFDAFFLFGEKKVQVYFSKRTFFRYAWLAEEYFQLKSNEHRYSSSSIPTGV